MNQQTDRSGNARLTFTASNGRLSAFRGNPCHRVMPFFAFHFMHLLFLLNRFLFQGRFV